MAEGYEDSSKLLDAKINEYDSTVRADAGLPVKTEAPKADGDLRNEVLRLLEDERRIKNMRFDEIYQLVESTKNMQSELINQSFDSQKALLKAIVNKEIAERSAADEQLSAAMSRQITLFVQDQGSDFSELQTRVKAQDKRIE